MRAAILVIALTACRYDGQFACLQNEECRMDDTPGTCEKAGWCSLIDNDCDSGRRFDETAGDGLAGTCVPGPTGCETWPARFLRPCGLPPPSGNLSLDGLFFYNTTDGTLTDALNMPIVQPSEVIDGVRYISVQDVTISATSQLRIVGDLPIVIAAWGSMMIAGTIDAGGHNGGGGPGFDPKGLCTAGEGADATLIAAGGGGGGGGFGGSGGMGGGGSAGGTGGAMPQMLRGGCSGGRSGNAGPFATSPASVDSHATPGKGGGALVLGSRLSLTIGGKVSVGGEGGGGSPMGAFCGGGGGGSGGMLVLDSPTVELHGTAIATGGGGGGVASRNAQGLRGSDASYGGAAGAAPGANCTGTGGTGSSPTSANGADGGTGACGGAGGGGGSGWILVFTQNFDSVGSMSAPTPSENPF
jgi:hypothetical protein